jgi:hypothetical protein
MLNKRLTGSLLLFLALWQDECEIALIDEITVVYPEILLN